MNRTQISSLVADNYPTASAEIQERLIEQYMRAEASVQNKCECGHIWVGPLRFHCTSCIIDIEKRERNFLGSKNV